MNTGALLLQPMFFNNTGEQNHERDTTSVNGWPYDICIWP